METSERVRLDKWLGAARIFKTRSLAAESIGHGRVLVNGQAAKPSREVRVSDRVELRQGPTQRTMVVLGISPSRGPAQVAQLLYRETPESLALREAADIARRLSPEPAASIEHGRPSKRNRRELAQWQRWSASVDDGS